MDPPDPERQDGVLRAAVLAGDAGAWKVIHDRHFDLLYAYVHCRTGRDAHRTEEVVQECWMAAVRRIRTFDPDRGSLEGWLRGIAANVLRNRRRAWGRLRRMERSIEGEAAIPRGPAAGDTHAREELAEQIALAWTALPARQQNVLGAKYVDGKSVDEIAREQGESPKAVESLLARAREAFRAAYGKIDGDD